MLNFNQFYFSKYRFNLIAEDDIFLPEYKGSTFRGVFGHYLKKTLCLHKRMNQNCNDCIIKTKCAYLYLFETPPLEDFNHSKKFNDYPRPYILVPPLSHDRLFKQGEEFFFEMVLIGEANQYLPYIIYVFEEIAKAGFKKDNGKFFIKNVETLDSSGMETEIYKDKILNNSEAKITFNDFTNEYKSPYPPLIKGEIDLPVGKQEKIIKNSVNEIKITFETPARIEIKDHLVNTPIPFNLLINNLLNRINLLNCLHCKGEYMEDLGELIRQAENISIDSANITWHEIERFSNRKKMKMFQGGIMGEIVYKGDIKDFIPILLVGEFIHIGKFTTLGLGKYRVVLTYSND